MGQERQTLNWFSSAITRGKIRTQGGVGKDESGYKVLGRSLKAASLVTGVHSSWVTNEGGRQLCIVPEGVNFKLCFRVKFWLSPEQLF